MLSFIPPLAMLFAAAAVALALGAMREAAIAAAMLVYTTFCMIVWTRHHNAGKYVNYYFRIGALIGGVGTRPSGWPWLLRVKFRGRVIINLVGKEPL